jgi:hypothetical protein
MPAEIPSSLSLHPNPLAAVYLRHTVQDHSLTAVQLDRCIIRQLNLWLIGSAIL